MKPLQVQVVRKIILFAEWAIFLGLLFGVAFFVQNVWFDYLSKATSIKQNSKTYHELEAELSRKFKQKNQKVFKDYGNFLEKLGKFVIFRTSYLILELKFWPKI